MQKQNTFPDASYKPLNIPDLNYSTNQFNHITLPHPKNINILPNNIASPYPNIYPRIKPTNSYGIAHTSPNSKKRTLLPSVLTGSRPSGVDQSCYWPHQNTMSGGSTFGND